MEWERGYMTLNIDYETSKKLDIDYEKIITDVVNTALDTEDCPYDIELNVILTDNEEIRAINKEHRNIDKATDVLSFPMVDYTIPSDFSHLEDDDSYFNFETGELILGDIIISVDKILEQAEDYGHSAERELAFLVAHSMMHLFGHDHMEDDERIVMEEKQEKVLKVLNINR